MDTGKEKKPAGVVSSASTWQAGSGSGSGGNRNNNAGDQEGGVPRELLMDSLMLSLSPPLFAHGLNNRTPPPPPPPAAVIAPVRAARRQQQPKNPNVPPPYPWATNQRATVHSLEYLLSKGIYTITGEVSCKKCRSIFTTELDLLSKYNEIKEYIIHSRERMHDRAPERWTNPNLASCLSCQHPNALKPTFGKKRNINWLFLMLNQMLGCCSLSHLKYFCKHTNNHRTGAKDRLLFLTYLGVCKQLQDIPAFQYHL